MLCRIFIHTLGASEDTKGAFSLSGKLDSVTVYRLAIVLGTETISFPLPPEEDLLRIVNSHEGAFVDGSKISITSEGWDVVLSTILQSLVSVLDFDPNDLVTRCHSLRIDNVSSTTASVQMMNVSYDVDTVTKRLGRLFIQLPSSFRGGVAYTEYEGQRYKHFLGVDDETNVSDVHYFFVGAGASYMTTKVSAGYRVFLVYDVLLRPDLILQQEIESNGMVPWIELKRLYDGYSSKTMSKDDILRGVIRMLVEKPSFVNVVEVNQLLDVVLYLADTMVVAIALGTVRAVTSKLLDIIQLNPTDLEEPLVNMLKSTEVGYFIKDAVHLAEAMLKLNIGKKAVEYIANQFASMVKEIHDADIASLGFKLLYRLNSAEIGALAIQRMTGTRALGRVIPDLVQEFGSEQTKDNSFFQELALKRKIKLEKLVDEGEPKYSLRLPHDIIPAKNNSALEEINDFLGSDADEFVYFGSQLSWKKLLTTKERIMKDFGLEISVDKPHGEPPTTSFKKTKTKFEKDLEDYNWRTEELRALSVIIETLPSSALKATPKKVRTVKSREHAPVDPHEKRFKCELCSYSTNHNQEFGYHMNKHLGIKPFKCPHCDYATEYRSNLRHHINARHTQKEENEEED